jgi:delta 1-pyrroline-5-carboxylate dehydrogenase
VFNYALVALGGSNVAGVNLGIKAGGGPNTIGWAVGSQPFGTGGGALSSVNPKVGDTVLIDLYYNKATGGVSATATDTTSGQTQTVNIAEGKSALFTSAEVAGFIHNPSSPPAANTRLWQLTNSHVTTYTGARGTMTGSWTTSQVIDTSNGRSTGHVVFSPSLPFNKGADFGAWLRAYLR